ncbi:CYTH domain-containing protein [Candidatus Gribaldobacteria bacterium]|nr:CYTH domain-containing protein [Candidatus Gribaldobacteria bacterium]
MQTEYEATFLNIDKDKMRDKLKELGAVLVKPEVLMKRYVFNLPQEKYKNRGWARVRDEGDKITMSFKTVNFEGVGKIDDQKEICLKIDNFENGVEFLKLLGCQEKAFQESKREVWQLHRVEICLDEWPFLEPFIEIEGLNESEVKIVSEKLGFNYKEALFCAVGTIYAKKYGKYGLDEMKINNQTPRIVFEMKNPFLS